MENASEQQVWIVQYKCQRCGKACEMRLAKPGFVPQYCVDCARKAASERVKRWRERHPEQAKATAKRYNDRRPKRGAKTASPVTGVDAPPATTQKTATTFLPSKAADVTAALTEQEQHLLDVFLFSWNEGDKGVLHWPRNSAAWMKDKLALGGLEERGFIKLLEKSTKGRR